MGAKVVDGRATGDNLVLPLVAIGGGLLGTVAIEVGFELGDAAEGTVLDQLGEGNEVGIEAAVYWLYC